MAASAKKQHLNDLASSLTYQIPFISGVKPLSQEDAVLLYGKDDIGGSVLCMQPFYTFPDFEIADV